MRIAFLADIHANLEALEACLDVVRVSAVDRIAFLGDIVGYGADPRACVDIVRDACARGAMAVLGNHDRAMLEGRGRFNEMAATALDWTRSVLDADMRRFLCELPIAIEDETRLYVHASAYAPDTFPYVRGATEAGDSLVSTTAWLTVVGHVHVPQLYNMSAVGKVLGFAPVSEVPIPLAASRRWLAVVGAVGQPRDGNPAAAFTLLDTAKSEITFHRVPYDVERAAAKIRAAGLPAGLWKRLVRGA